MGTALELVAVAAIIAANAFFVIAEYSLVTARRSASQQQGNAGARRALRLMENPVRVISTVQIGITALGILLGAVGEPVFRELVGDALPSWFAFAFTFLIVTHHRRSHLPHRVRDEGMNAGLFGGRRLVARPPS